MIQYIYEARLCVYEAHSKASLEGKIANEMLFEPPPLNNSSVSLREHAC